MTSDAGSRESPRDPVGRLLGRFADIVAGTDDPRPAAEWALREVAAEFAWPVGHALLVDSDGNITSWLSWSDPGPRWETYLARNGTLASRPPSGLLGRVVSEGRPAWVPDLSAEPDYPRARSAREAGLRGAVAFPVLSADVPAAVLEYLSEERLEPSSEFLEAATVMGTLLGQVIERQRARDLAVDSSSRLHRIVDTAGTALIAVDGRGRVREWNREAERMFGWARDEAIHRDLAGLAVPPELRGRRAGSGAANGGILGAANGGETVALRKDGVTFPVHVSAWNVPDGDGGTRYLFLRDRSDAQARAEGRAHDTLTGLVNRTTLVTRLDQAVRRMTSGAPGPAVLAIDVDGSRATGTPDGAQDGDQRLVSVARWISAMARPGDVVARVSHDRFALMLNETATEGAAVAVARRVIGRLAVPGRISHRRSAAGVHIGVALATPGCDAASLLSDADAALTRAKRSGPEQWAVYGDGPARRSVRRNLERDLAAAMRDRRLELFYQPIFSLPERRITGAEALLRWRHPDRGLLLPGEFIDIAERSGLIAPIGEWVLTQACHQLTLWRQQRCSPDLRVAVNLSARQLTDPNIVSQVSDTIDLARATWGDVSLCLEITESVLMDNPRAAADTVAQLKDLGLTIAIDDFGTGYSSLAYLKWFDVDIVKVDRSFVAGMVRNRTDRAIVKAVVELARDLDLSVIAEGVETEEQLTLLADLGCSHVQGFLLGRPQTAGRLGAVLSDQASRAGVNGVAHV